jgi:O-Antigen ligase
MDLARDATVRSTEGTKLMIAAAPAALLIATLGFASGGYFPGAAEFVLCGIAAALAAWMLLAEQPLGSVGRGLTLAIVAMTAYVTWVLLSGLWSDAKGRAMLEFDRGLLYLLALILGGLVASSAARMRWVARAAVVGGLAVCAAGLLSRTFPDLITTAASFDGSRLSFPITYWNGLGALAALTLVLSFSLAADRNERLVGRVLAAAACPALVATLVLTLGRGPAAAAAIGLVGVAVLGFSRGLLVAAVACIPGGAVTAAAAVNADVLTTTAYTSDVGVAEGHELALVVGLAAVGGAALMAILHPLERRLPAGPSTRRGKLAAGGAFAAIAIAIAIAAGAPGFIDRSVDEFVSQPSLRENTDQGDRLLQFSSNGRVDHWQVALEEFERHPLAGSGAGTYQPAWDRLRPTSGRVRDAHSLFAETLAELGLVGLALLALVLITIGVGFVRRARGEDRVLFAGFAAAFLSWVMVAAVDWVWELPAVTAWLFFAGGAALASATRAKRSWASRSWSPVPRGLAAVGILLLCVMPLRVGLSQGPLERGREALRADACGKAIDESLASVAAYPDRAAPYAVLAYCDVRMGDPRLALRMMKRAVALDPDNWSYHYGLALVRASAGLDPRRQVATARALNPRDVDVATAVTAFRDAHPDQWPRRAARLRLPFAELR